MQLYTMLFNASFLPLDRIVLSFLIKLLNKMTFKKWIGRGLSSRSKISLGSPTISKILSSTSIKTSWPAHTVTPPKDRCIGAYYLIGPAILGKLACSNKKNERASDFYFFLKREIKLWRMNGMPKSVPCLRLNKKCGHFFPEVICQRPSNYQCL